MEGIENRKQLVCTNHEFVHKWEVDPTLDIAFPNVHIVTKIHPHLGSSASHTCDINKGFDRFYILIVDI